MMESNEILKKILLHMKYDTRKTLSENKIMINEETQTKIVKSLDGSDFEISSDAYDIRYTPSTPYIKPGFNRFDSDCKWIETHKHKTSYQFKNIENCINDYNTYFVEHFMVPNGVISFKVKQDGIEREYFHCTGTADYINKIMYPPDKMYTLGYFAKSPTDNLKLCGSIKYELKPAETPTINDEPSGSKVKPDDKSTKDTKGQGEIPFSNKTDDKGFVDNFSFDLEL